MIKSTTKQIILFRNRIFFSYFALYANLAQLCFLLPGKPWISVFHWTLQCQSKLLVCQLVLSLFLSLRFKFKLSLLEYIRYIFYYWTISIMKNFSKDLINPSFGTGSSLGGRLSQCRVWIQGEICCPKYWNSMYLLQVLIEEMLLKWIHNSKVKA